MTRDLLDVARLVLGAIVREVGMALVELGDVLDPSDERLLFVPESMVVDR